jgi:chromosome segregation ATPase
MPQMPPMILLDEVDAHLDQDNIDLLSKFLKDWNSQDIKKQTPQIIMISHQEEALAKCDSLIGVTQEEYLKTFD